MQPASVDRSFCWNTRALILLVALALLTLALLGVPSVERTQEARVLETARQMRIAAADHDGVRAFLIPHINGLLRLQKPPLAYWLAAGAYSLFGVANAWVGRVPFALISLANSIATYLIGRRLLGARAAFFAASACAACLMNVRFGNLAETDMLAACFTTIAAYAYWHGIGLRPSERPDFGTAARWFHLGAAATAFAAMAKGPPASFPVLFFIALVMIRRDWQSLVRWLLCGAPITFAVLGLSWFGYIIRTVGWATFKHELQVVTEGGGHKASFASYFAYLVIDTAPWSILTVLALVVTGIRLWPRCDGIRRRRDPRLVGLALWIATTLVPLCLIGQKQRHYLVPLMPPVMLLVGWFADRALRRAASAELMRVLLFATGVLAAIAVIILPILGRVSRGYLAWQDGVIAFAMLMLAAAIMLPSSRKRENAAVRATMALAWLGPVCFVVLQLLWAPTLPPWTSRTIAQDVWRSFGNRPVQFVPGDDLPLMFEYRTLNDRQPPRGPVLILQTSRARDDVPPPLGTRELRRYYNGSDLVRVCQTTSSAPAPTTEVAATQPSTVPIMIPIDSR